MTTWIRELTRRPGPRGAILGASGAIVCILLGALLPNAGLLRTMIAICVAFLLIGCGIRAPKVLVLAVAWWLALLGLLRRLLSGVTPPTPTGDPLLLVSALAWACLALIAFGWKALRNRTPLANAVLLLTGALAVSALNPLQGNLAVGLGGFLLVVIPMQAFWIGRSVVDDKCFHRLLQTLGVVAFATALYGLYQTFVAMPSWDARWIVNSGYGALNVGGTIRAFSSFSSASEYASFLAVGIIIYVAATRRLRWLVPMAVPMVIVAIAIWFESARGSIVLLLAGIWLMAAAARRLTFATSLIIGVALLGAVPFVVGRLAPAQFASSPSAQLSAHQVQGLTDPFGAKSTLPDHLREVIDGVRLSVSNPIGRGVGTVTIAVSKYGGTGAGVEADPGNAAIGAGIIGLIGYVLCVVWGFRTVYQLQLIRRDRASLAALGILVVLFLQWLNGDQYAVVFLPWLVLGWADRALSRERGHALQAAGQLHPA